MALQINVRVGDRRQIVFDLVQRGSPQLDLTAADVVYLDLIRPTGTQTYASTDPSAVFTVDSAGQVTLSPTAGFFTAAGTYYVEFRAVYGLETFFAPSVSADRIKINITAG